MTDQSNVDTATRIAAADDGTNYDNVAVTLHWLTALLVVTQFALAQTWDWFSHDASEAMQSAHVSLGILLAAVVVARLLWRWSGHQRPSIVSGWVEIASTAVHHLFYALLVAQAALGFAIGWANGHPIHFFGIGIPGPLDALPRPQRHELREFHEKIGWAIIILAFGHALAALYHHYVVKDRVLERMLPLARRSRVKR